MSMPRTSLNAGHYESWPDRVVVQALPKYQQKSPQAQQHRGAQQVHNSPIPSTVSEGMQGED